MIRKRKISEISTCSKKPSRRDAVFHRRIILRVLNSTPFFELGVFVCKHQAQIKHAMATCTFLSERDPELWYQQLELIINPLTLSRYRFELFGNSPTLHGLLFLASPLELKETLDTIHPGGSEELIGEMLRANTTAMSSVVSAVSKEPSVFKDFHETFIAQIHHQMQIHNQNVDNIEHVALGNREAMDIAEHLHLAIPVEVLWCTGEWFGFHRVGSFRIQNQRSHVAIGTLTRKENPTETERLVFRHLEGEPRKPFCRFRHTPHRTLQLERTRESQRLQETMWLADNVCVRGGLQLDLTWHETAAIVFDTLKARLDRLSMSTVLAFLL